MLFDDLNDNGDCITDADGGNGNLFFFLCFKYKYVRAVVVVFFDISFFFLLSVFVYFLHLFPPSATFYVSMVILLGTGALNA